MAQRATARGQRGFSLLEMMAVISIASIIAMLAVPNMVSFARSYRGREAAIAVYNAVNAARGLSQKLNEPVVAVLGAGQVQLLRGNYGGGTGFLLTSTDWSAVERTISLPTGITLVATGDLVAGNPIAFCPSSEYRFIDQTGLISPDGANGTVCGVAQLASEDGVVHFTAHDQAWTLRVRGALGHLELQPGHQ